MSNESTALAVQGSTNSSAIVTTTAMFTAEQERMIREMYAPTATDLEFEVLLAVARARRLNPILGQIHFVKRRVKDDHDGWIDKWTHVVAIDGFRAKAEESGLYDGQDEPEFEWEPAERFPLLARIKVYRKGIARPFVGVARWDEYVQKDRSGAPVRMWAQMPTHMLAKCAEAIALRKAFPEHLGGLYTADEMSQAENTQKQWRVVAAADPGPHTGHRAKVPPPKPPTADEIEIMSGDECEEVIRRASRMPGLRALAYARLISLAASMSGIDSLVRRVDDDSGISPEANAKLRSLADHRAIALGAPGPDDDLERARLIDAGKA